MDMAGGRASRAIKRGLGTSKGVGGKRKYKIVLKDSLEIIKGVISSDYILNVTKMVVLAIGKGKQRSDNRFTFLIKRKWHLCTLTFTLIINLTLVLENIPSHLKKRMPRYPHHLKT